MNATKSVPPKDSVEDVLPQIGARIHSNDGEAELYSRARLPTASGDFTVFVFRSSADALEHVALVRGNPRAQENVPVRLHSECLTGDVLGSLRCDCREQLERAMAELGKADCSMLLYLRQEGRGIGLGNKIRAYALQQEQGLDTYEANLHLGFDDDLRRYDIAAGILKLFGVQSVQLLTNNPRKVFGLKSAGVEVIARIPLIVGSNQHNSAYLAAKAKRSGHLLEGV